MSVQGRTLARTVLGTLNRSYQTKFFGRDVLREAPAGGLAFISINRKLGYITEDGLLIIGPKKYLAAYYYVPKNGSVREVGPGKKDVRGTLGNFPGACAV